MTNFIRRWLIPDIALILSIITMIYCMASFSGMQLLFRDSDTGWHIRNGEQILASGAVPYTEPYSFSKPGGPWFAWEWLADIVMAEAHSWDGLRGVFFLYLFTIGVVTWLWFQLVWTTKTWFLLGSASTWVMLTTCNIHWLSRPHLFSWVFLLLAVLAVERAPSGLDWRWLVAIGVLGVVWANVHGSFFLGAAIFFLYAFEKFFRRDPSWQPLAIGGVVIGLTSFINPYTWHVHEHIFHYLRDKELLARIGEFQTFNFHVEGSEALVIGMLITAAGISLNFTQGRFARGVLCLVMFVGALRSARGLPMMALIGLPLALSSISHALAQLPRLAGAARYNENLRLMESGFKGYLLMPVVLFLFLWIGRSPVFSKPAGFPAEIFPVEITGRFDQKLPPTARLFSTDRFGGYMIYRFAGKRKVFFDGRSDYYGSDFMKDYLLIPDGKPGWETQFKRWNFTHALLPKDSPLIELLTLKGWREIDKDPTSVLLEKGSQ